MQIYNLCLNDRLGHARFKAVNVTVGTRFGSPQLQQVPTTWVLYYLKYPQSDKLETSLSLSLSLSTKLQLYWVLILPVILCGAETWSSTWQLLWRKIDAFDR